MTKITIDNTELDLVAVLAQQRVIAVLWTVADVRNLRPDLTEEQAWYVLYHCNANRDRTAGITGDTLEQTAYDLWGSPVSRRVDRCSKALRDYGEDDPVGNLIDFLADAMHWCDRRGIDFTQKVRCARSRFRHESGE